MDGDEIEIIQAQVIILQNSLLGLAKKYAESLMPAYTHMQRAQPVTIASYLLSYVEQFERDYRRLANNRTMLNVSPLGSGAVAGSTLELDRKTTAVHLGFTGLCYNSIDAVADRDFCADFIFSCSMISMHLSRLAEDWIIYSTNEFNFIKIDDAFCTSSSMMPQKRNPDMLELIRGKTGSVYGALMAILTILKGLPSSYNRDLQEDKIHVFSVADTVEACVEMAAAIAQHTKFNIENIRAGMDKGFLDATALAEYLVRKKIPFRQAHGIVGSLVAICEEQNKPSLNLLSLEEFKQFCPAIEEDVYENIGAANVVRQYATIGAGGLKQTKEQIEFWDKYFQKR